MAKFRTIASLASLAAALAAAAESQSSAVAARKILEKRCLSCHGSAQMSGLDLRQRETMLRAAPEDRLLNPAKLTKASCSRPPRASAI